MSEATLYDDPTGEGGGTAVAGLDFCESCHAGDHDQCSEGNCECDGLCAARRARSEP